MKDNDLVELIISPIRSASIAVPMTRKQASDLIWSWYNTRENLGNKRWITRLWHRVKTLCQPWTIAWKCPGSESETYAIWAIDAQMIASMCMRDVGDSIQDKMVQVQSKVAEALLREANRGDEWRDENE